MLLLGELEELLYRDCLSGGHHQQACPGQIVKETTFTEPRAELQLLQLSVLRM